MHNRKTSMKNRLYRTVGENGLYEKEFQLECKDCGKQFIATSPQARYCCSRCRREGELKVARAADKKRRPRKKKKPAA